MWKNLGESKKSWGMVSPDGVFLTIKKEILDVMYEDRLLFNQWSEQEIG